MPPVRCAVLGAPIAHSLSPTLHRAAYAALELEDWSYHSMRVPAGTCQAMVSGLGPDWHGLSITMPLKKEALDLADTASELARLTGSANTLLLGKDGVHADNTDTPGAVAAVRERWNGPVERICVVGAGSTAVSVAWALAELGARDIALLARPSQRAGPNADLIRAHPSAPRVSVVDLVEDQAPERVEADLVASTVPVEAQSAGLVDAVATVPAVFDVLYHPWPTPLAAAAVASGRTLISGFDLLVHQAALQVTAFTGKPAPLETMRAAGRAALAARTDAG